MRVQKPVMALVSVWCLSTTSATTDIYLSVTHTEVTIATVALLQSVTDLSEKSRKTSVFLREMLEDFLPSD